jgi:hypothetical protein
MFLFQQKSAEIAAHNSNKANSWEKGHNQFSCLTSEEFETLHLGAIPPSESGVRISDNRARDDGSSASSESTESNDDSESSEDTESSESNSVQSSGKKLKDEDHPNVKAPVYHADR